MNEQEKRAALERLAAKKAELEQALQQARSNARERAPEEVGALEQRLEEIKKAFREGMNADDQELAALEQRLHRVGEQAQAATRALRKKLSRWLDPG